ncbi:holin family protein [Anaerobacillus sp. MEB173]|uniref:phage holin family protein n=1 Tax=Anaerobacillus sp. MEB173 TaxID=3383345 RepID=UPI003F9173CB
MKYQTDTLYTYITGGAFAGAAFLLGGIDNLIIALGIIMAVDFATGVGAGWGKEKTSSKRAFKGLMKKGAMISLVIVANQLDVISGSESGFLRNAMIFFLIGTEGISILENMNKLGVKFPAFLSQRFEQMVNHNEKNNRKDDKE